MTPADVERLNGQELVDALRGSVLRLRHFNTPAGTPARAAATELDARALELMTIATRAANVLEAAAADRPALPVVGGVGEQWAEYLVACELLAAPPAQLEELKRAFYAGAQGMYYAVLGAAANEDEAAADAHLEAIARELGDYIRNFKAREGLA